MKKLIALFLLLTLCLPLLVACASGDAGGGYYESPAATGAGESTDGNDAQEQVRIPAGQLTAAEWNDNEQYAEWLKLFETVETEQGNEISGAYAPYVTQKKPWNLPFDNRITVSVYEGEAPVAGAKVTLTSNENDNSVIYAAVTNAKGVAYLFGDVEDGTIYVTSGDASTMQAYAGEETVEVQLQGASQKQNVIEIMFVIDTTGSMRDEMEYLKAEIDDVIGRVKEATGAEVRLALLFYRDEGDDYVTRYFDFTTNIQAQQDNLKAQSSKGGGDFPEAVHKALDEAVSKQWSTGNVTKLLFHVLDAPPHETEKIASTYQSAIREAAENGIRIIPVASSGIDGETEYLLRSEALLTGGTYTFLTDDSGIGSSHFDPTISGQYTVELLNSLLVRLIREFHTGEDIPPVDWRQEVGSK